MKKSIIILSFLLVFLLAWLGIYITWSHADTHTAATCEEADIVAAISAASEGDVVSVPAGNCEWTDRITCTKGITLQGNGIDSTVITDSVPTAAGQTSKEALLWNVTSGSSGGRITGFTFVDGNASYYNYLGVVRVSGTVAGFRIDHNEFDTFSSRAISSDNTTSTGLIDHNTFTNCVGGVFNRPPTATGYALWLVASSLGGSDALFVEDNVANNSGLSTVEPFYDGEFGSKTVIRNNTFTKVKLLNHGYEGQASSIRLEIYNNTISLSGTTSERAIVFRGGTGIVYGNTITGTWSAGLYARDYCSCESTVCQHDYCYSYPCVQQVGRTSGPDYPGQTLEPIFQFHNTYGGATPAFSIEACSASYIQENRDFYDDKDAVFDGTVGVGTSDHGSRPATCTTGVGWWDGSTLDKCTSTNTWTEAYYTPYTYPHPLQGGTAVPTGSVVVDGGLSEAQIVAGGKTIIITLTDDTWVATVGQNNAINLALRNGVDSDKAEASGWDAVVKAGMEYNDVVRTSNTVVTITLDAEAAYNITEAETITVTIPATAVTSGVQIVAEPSFIISADPAVSASKGHQIRFR